MLMVGKSPREFPPNIPAPLLILHPAPGPQIFLHRHVIVCFKPSLERGAGALFDSCLAVVHRFFVCLVSGCGRPCPLLP